MQRISKRESTAHHEAAHAVIDYILCGRLPILLTIKAAGDVLGLNCGTHPIYDGITAPEAKDAIVVLYAGHAAQVKLDPDPRKYERYWLGAADDDEKADVFISYIGSDKQLLEGELRSRARDLVKKNWVAITTLAKELLLHERLDDCEVQIIIESALGNEESELTLAKYRRNRDA